jgi:hypothetical protein
MLSARERNLLVGANLWYFGEGMLGPLFAVFAQKVGGNVLDITWAWAVFLVVTGVSIIFVGRWSDSAASKRKHAREKILIAGCTLNTICTFGYLLVEGPVGLFLVQAGLGLGLALASPTWLALYGDADSKLRSGMKWALTSGTEKFVTAGAIVLGGYIVTQYSFETLFIIMGCVQILATLYQARILWAPR